MAAQNNEFVALTAPVTAGGQTFQNWAATSGTPLFTTSGPGLRRICVAGDNSNGLRRLTANYAAGAVVTTLVVDPASGTYGGTTTLTATLTSGSPATGVSAKSVAFTLNGNSVGAATTNASGIATLNGASLDTINAGIYSGGVSASFAGDSGFNASTGTANLTVTKAAQTITFGALGNKLYGYLPLPSLQRAALLNSQYVFPPPRQRWMLRDRKHGDHRGGNGCR